MPAVKFIEPSAARHLDHAHIDPTKQSNPLTQRLRRALRNFVAEFISKKLYTFSSIRDHVIPKRLECSHSAPKVVSRSESLVKRLLVEFPGSRVNILWFGRLVGFGFRVWGFGFRGLGLKV